MKQVFSTNEAAVYLDLTIPTIKYHLYRSKKLSGQMFGNSLMFTRDQLDEFKSIPRPVGRPKIIKETK